MRFAQEFWLYLMPALPALWLLARVGDRRARMRLDALLGPAAAQHVERHNPRLRSWDRFLFFTGAFFLLLALARPQWGASEVTVTQRGSDIVVALDISNSMLAEDIPPNRLERAKAELGSFMQRLQNSRIGLVFFAGAAFVQCPLTLDYGTAEIFLNLAGPDMLSEQGTAVGAALQTARELLAKGRGGGETGAFQAILLVTDGEDLEGQWEAAARACLDEGIRIIPVGVGEETGGLIPVQDRQGRSAGYMKDEDGSVVMTRLEMAFLEKLASMGGGSPFRIGVDGLAGDRLFQELQRLGQRDLEDRRISAYQERYLAPLLLAMFCFALRLALRSRLRGARIGQERVAAALAAGLLCLTSAGAAASPFSPEVSQVMDAGRRSYQEGDFQAALSHFGSALALRPEDPRISLAVGETLHQLQKYQEAVREFDRAAGLATDPDLRAEAQYNAGTSLLAAGDAQSAIRRYRDALSLDPTQQDAVHNLEVALRRLQEQEEQKEEKKEEEKEQQDQKEQDQQKDEQQQDQQQNQQQEQQQPGQKNQDQDPQDQKPQDQESPDQGSPDDRQQEQRQQPDQPPPGQDQQPREDQPQDQESDQQQSDQKLSDQELTREQAMQILNALDRDEQELRRSVQQRIKGGKPKSGKRW